jgi:hypothetical protein
MKKQLQSLFTGLLLALVVPSQGQTIRCFTDELHQQLEASDASYNARRDAIQKQTARYVASPSKTRSVITIPVVFHIIYKTAQQNVSTQQIMSQLNSLNQDFQKLNADWSLTPTVFQNLVADCEIQFCLAQQDPNGNPTTGIVRVPTAVTGFTTNDAMKYTASGGSNAWNRNNYLNIWVCNFSVGVLGYAQFPGGPAATDGVVCNYLSFGNMGTATYPYNKGRTLTHEIGHWLNLKHIWGDDGTGCLGSDDVQDTPNQAGSNSSCPIFPKISCNNGPNGDMFMNYMDYTPDNCMYMFTQGQKLVMEAQFANGGSRSSLLSSPGCNLALNINCDGPTTINSGAVSHQSAEVSWAASAFSQGYIIELKSASDTTWSSYNTNTTSYTFNGLASGTLYQCRVQSACNGSNSNYSGICQFTTLSSACLAPSNMQAATINPNSCTLNWSASAVGSSYAIQYKQADDTTWTTLSGIMGTSVNISGLIASSVYVVRIRSLCGNVYSDYSLPFIFSTIAPLCANNYEPNDIRQQAKPITPFVSLASLLQTATDKDFYVFTTTAASPKVSITLNNLPADYDLRLLGSNGLTILRTSATRGLSKEVINYNLLNTGSTYYLHVYGFNGANNNQTCYNLTVRTSASPFREIANEFDTEKEFSFVCFPNPAQNELLVEYDANVDLPTTWKIYNVTGQLLQQFQDKANDNGMVRYSMDISTLSNGIYFLESNRDNSRNIERFQVLK